jgi:glutamine amidotransferase-like uncharacterized protein
MKRTVALFTHQPRCCIESVNGIITSLHNDYRFKIFTRHPVDDDFFDDVDLLCMPGGVGDADGWDWLMDNNLEIIDSYLERQGKYLGICMGAYWADSYYFDLLEGIDVHQYITRAGADTRRPHAKAQPVNWCGEDTKMYFYDGCSFTGPGLATSKIWATYPNGDAMALIQGNIGVIGCHPESEQSWYDDYSWLPRHWHRGYHHKLLLDFVRSLLK